MAFPWTDKQIETLKKLWADGLTAQAISDRLGVGSRSAVIGKANRLLLASRRDSNRVKRKPKPITSFNHTPKKQVVERFERDPYVYRETVVDGCRPIPFEALEAFDRKCRYAHGESHPYTFCGLPTVMGTSWCPQHLKAISPTFKAKAEGAVAIEPVTGRHELEAAQ